MSIFNYKSKEIIVKIVYYGPGVGGKTTSIQRLHEKTIPERKGELYFLATEADQTIYFELLPLYAGEIGNFTGISDPFESPENPEIVLKTHDNSLDVSVSQVIKYLEDKGLI